MWECIFRSEPYPNMNAFNVGAEVAYKGLTPTLPDENEWPICHTLMKSIFQSEPSKRPTMDEIYKQLKTEK